MRLLALFLFAVSWEERVNAFQNPIQHHVTRRPCRPSCRFPTNELVGVHQPIQRMSPLSLSQRAQQEEQQQEESLSDVDARVLREMLQESKLDLQTEDDIKKLLERGTVKSTVNPKEVAQKEEQQRREESPFDSTILQTFTDTKLWKKLSAQTSDLLESAKIWVSNKVEQDLQVAAALGLFAWERAVRDVARALPAAASVAKAPPPPPNLLTNTSSYEEPPATPTTGSVWDDVVRPADEIKDVSRAIWGILQGDQTAASNSRGLRTVAQAGTVNSADRQKRAFTQRRRLDRRDRDISRIAGSVVDATYELQRELKAETSQAGYKTKPLRKAIAAGTAGVLSAVKDTARLAAAKRQETLQLKQAAIDRTTVYAQLVRERTAMLERLSDCIAAPQNTWLASPDEALAEATRQMTEEQLREVATLLVVIRNDMMSVPLDLVDVSENTVSVEQFQQVLQVLRSDVQALAELAAQVEQDASSPVAIALYSSIVGITQEQEVQPLLLRLDEVEASIQPPPPVDPQTMEPTEQSVFFADTIVNDNGETVPTSTAMNNVEGIVSNDVETSPNAESEYMDAVFIDVEPDMVFQTNSLVSDIIDENIETSVEADETWAPTDYKSFVAEVVSDEDVDTVFGGAKQVENLSEEEFAAAEVEEEPNVAVLALLRVFDVVFFVLEKSFTVVLPATFRYSVTAAQRFKEVQQSGQGREGWELLRQSADAKGRY